MIYSAQSPHGCDAKTEKGHWKMEYEPLKDRILALVNFIPGFRRILYKILDMQLLRQRYVKHYIKKYYNTHANMRVYDAGAGYCQYSDFILSQWRNSHVLASDLKLDYLESFALDSAVRYGARFRYKRADLQVYEPRRNFDLVLAIDILEHVEDDIRVLRIFNNCLCEGGRLIISTPSVWDEASAFTEEHVRPGYDMDDLKSKLQDSGFRVDKTIYTYGYWGHLSWLLLIKYPLLVYTRSKTIGLLLPLYYLIVYPLAWLMMRVDFGTKNLKGTGMLVVAVKEN